MSSSGALTRLLCFFVCLLHSTTANSPKLIDGEFFLHSECNLTLAYLNWRNESYEKVSYHK
ncbi:unnamed protein product [Haemonchus placei]|uniref:IL4R n=1 Tax=Haemonchus placei TaxID=6290 RepID=A0A0N4WEA1_HAEPC|nr:unnamed protein product [Haemonchus placei]